EYTDAMKMRARLTSNFTYADREGNIYYLWNAALPLLPHAPVDEVTAVPAKRAADMWSRYVPFEELPQMLNPPGGYIRNENNSHHYTNTRTPANIKNAYPNFEQPRLSLRSQLGIQLIDPERKLSLEDNIELKHNYRALLADRVKADLIAAVKATKPTGDVASALRVLEGWDNTTSAESRGSVLFQLWWNEYSGLNRPERRAFPDDQRYARVWSTDDPYNTPRGLADTKRAAAAFASAVEEIKKRHGSFRVSWGDVHRVRRGNVDEPVGGCGNDLGCFRIMTYERDKDGKMAAIGGDGWVFAVEFGDVPRAYTILAYGQSNLPDSPHFADQAAMFARGEMKKIAFTEADIKAQAIRTYRPGGSR
ncbi:MAG: penicillin acylase family protein, partial [Blastocatellia bacterium]|nr:penicillin acylase family protein [Blastocatellia bacterium]